MKTSLDTMMEYLGNAMKPIYDLFEFTSLWVSDHKKRYHVGDEVNLYGVNGFTTDTEFPTHKIVKLMGTLNDSKHEIHFEDLKTGEITIITL